MAKLENKLKTKKIKIGILGGSFDPAHKGHLAISKEAIQRFNLRSVIWAITSQNPFKEKIVNNLKKRIIICKKIIGLQDTSLSRRIWWEQSRIKSVSCKSMTEYRIAAKDIRVPCMNFLDYESMPQVSKESINQ